MQSLLVLIIFSVIFNNNIQNFNSHSFIEIELILWAINKRQEETNWTKFGQPLDAF